MKKLILFLAIAVLTPAGVSFSQITEAEGNDSKAAANIGTVPTGATITGNSISAATTGLDYFRFSIPGLTPGIYRHRLVLNSNTAGHTATIRGLNQTGTGAAAAAGTGGTIGATDTTVQTGQTVGTTRVNQFYGFGNSSAELYYRVTGAAATTADYVSTLETQVVTPANIGTYNPGPITITTWNQGHTTDTDFWVYDSNFNAMPGFGNDDESGFGSGAITPSTSLQGWLTRTYAPGTYYLALTNFNLANNQASANDEGFTTGAVLDFAGFVANTSTTANVNTTFSIGEGSGVPTNQFSNTKVGAFDINWFTFTVVPEPSAMMLCLVGMSFLARRRRS